MTDTIEGGAVLAWRLLATLEGGTVLLATAALLAYTVRNKVFQQTSFRRNVRNVLITNTSNSLGRALTRSLEANGCVVKAVPTVTSDTDSRLITETKSGADKKVDAIIVVGAASNTDSLDGIANHVTEDVYDNLKLLESISSQVRPGGYIAWACACDKYVGTYRDAAAAFDTVLHASLLHLAKMRNCSPVWVGRSEDIEQVVERIVAALLINKTE